MTERRPAEDRRRHLRFPLGLPVMIHPEGPDESLTVELVDIALRSARFRTEGRALSVDQRASFGFVIAGQMPCVATGRVLRVAGGGEFVLAVERANPAFHSFVGSLGGG